jgi:hypothetical protein
MHSCVHGTGTHTLPKKAVTPEWEYSTPILIDSEVLPASLLVISLLIPMGKKLGHALCALGAQRTEDVRCQTAPCAETAGFRSEKRLIYDAFPIR